MHATILRTVDTETQGTIVDPNRAPKLIDPNTNQIVAILKSAYDVTVTDDMITGTAGQEVLDFKMPFHARERDLIKTEMIIEVMGSRFHVRTPWDGWDSGSPISIASIHCEAEWYLLGERDPITMPKQTTAHNAMATIIGNTGWTLGAVEVSAPGGSLTITDQMSPLAALRLVPQAFGGELEFDNLGKVVHLRAQRGSSSVVTMYAHGRNLVGNARTEDTTNLVTRLYVQGAQAVDSKGEYQVNPDGTPKYVDITSVNGGLPYLEDYSFYINRNMPGVIRAATVSADTITDPQTLKDWGAAQLAAMSQAAFTYQIQQSNTGVDDVEVALGDVVRVHDDDLGIDVNARIQGRVINVMQPWLTTYTVDTGLFTLSNALVGVGGGTVIQGGGGATAADSTIPNAPASVSIVATATAADYSAVLVQVEASWAQVTANTDSTLIGDLDHYEVEYQITTHDLLSGTDKTSAWTRQSVSAGSTSALITLSAPNLRVTVRVRAVDTFGNASSWTTQGPQVILPGTTTPPTPSTPTLVAGNDLPGVVTVHWDGQSAAGGLPADFMRLDVHVGVPGFAPTAATLVDQLTAAGNSVLALKAGTWDVRFIAVNSSLQQSPASAPLSVTTRQVVDGDILNSTISAAKVAFQIGGGNLVSNSSFEVDTTNWYSGSNPVGTITRSNAVPARHGAWHGAVTSTGAGTMNAYCIVTVNPGDKCVVSYYVRTPVARSIELAVTFYSSAFAVVGTWPVVTLAATDPNGWTRIVASGVVPAGGVNMVPIIRMPGVVAAGEVMYIDAVQVENGDVITAYAPKPDEILPGTITETSIADNAITTPKLITGAVVAGKIGAGAVSTEKLTVGSISDNMVPNGNLEETSTVDPTIPARFSRYEDNGGVTYAMVAGGVGGVQCARLTKVTTAYAALATDFMPVAEGETFYASLRALASDPNVQLIFRVVLFDVNKGNAFIASDNWPSAPTAWTKYEASVTVPAGYRFARIVAYNYTANVPAPVGSWLEVDDFTFQKITGSAAIADASIVNAKIALLAVDTARINELDLNNARISTMSVGKISTGTLNADILVGARIKTADTGPRAEVSGTGIYLIDGNGNQLLSAKIVSGVASIDIIGNIKAGSSLPITVYTEQLVANGNFEDVDLTGFPQFWTQDNAVGGGTGYSETNQPLSGSRAFVIHCPNGSAGAGYRNIRTVPVAAGERLVCKIDFKIAGTPTNGQNSIYLRIYWYDINGNGLGVTPAPVISPQILTLAGTYVATPPTGVAVSYTDVCSGWTGWTTSGGPYRIAGEVTAPPGAAFAGFCFYAWSNTGGGDSYYIFDNAYIARTLAGNSIRSGYVTGAWLRTGESGKRIEMGTDRGATYAYNVMYFYTGWTANGVGESITFGPFYGAVQSSPMQGYVAVDVTTETGGSSPTGRIMGNLRLQSPKLTADTATDTWAALQVHSTILDTTTGTLVADSDAVQIFASKFYFLGMASGENQVILQSYYNNQRIALLFRAWDGHDVATISTVTQGGNYVSGAQIGEFVIKAHGANMRVGIAGNDGGGTWFDYNGGMTVIGTNVTDNALSFRGTTGHSLGSTNWENSVWGNFLGSAFSVQSSLLSKANIEPIEPGWAKSIIREAPAYRWKYVHGDFADLVNGEPDENGQRAIRAAGSEDWHFSPMYEHLHEDVRDSEGEGVDLRDLIGVQWAALTEVFDELDALRAEVRELREEKVTA